MSFLNTFIELSLLDEAQEQNSQLSNHNYLLKKQNELLQQQNEGINALLAHNQQQDWIRDYIYRINKLCDQLQSYADKTSIQYYYSIYCLAKSVNDSGITTSSISELKDKEYFDNCLDKIGNLFFAFVNNNKEKILEYNKHIQNIEESSLFFQFKSIEDARYRIQQIKEIVKDYEKCSKITKLSFLFSFTPFTILMIIYFVTVHNPFFIPIWFIIFIWILLSMIVGGIINDKWKRKLYPDVKKRLKKEAYDKLIKEKLNCENKLHGNVKIYQYAKTIIPDYDFYDNEKDKLNLIHETLENKKREIDESYDLLNNADTNIYEKYYLKE